MKKNLRIVTSAAQENEYIENKLIEYNAKHVPFTQHDPFIPLNFVLKDENGIIFGGIISVLYCWQILYIDILWVDEQRRNSGYGSELLHTVESAAQKQGCVLAHLDTFDFQGKDFYLKHGYEICGRIDDCPPGHTRYFMKKRFL